MESTTWFEEIKDWIGSVAWRVFLWSINSTQEEYWHEIYQQEYDHIESLKED